MTQTFLSPSIQMHGASREWLGYVPDKLHFFRIGHITKIPASNVAIPDIDVYLLYPKPDSVDLLQIFANDVFRVYFFPPIGGFPPFTRNFLTRPPEIRLNLERQ